MDIETLRRIERMERTLERLATVEKPMSSGSQFPTGINTGFLFFRSDLGFLCYYDGTRWLTAHEYEANLNWFQLVTLPYTGAAPQTLLLQPIRSNYGLYYTRAQAYIRVQTTNNGSNYWALRLFHGATNLWDFNTSASAPDTNLFFNTSLSSAQSASATFMTLNAQTKTGAPGGLVTSCSVFYRLIVP